MQNKIIIFTGGGTAGHVTPNIALIKKLQKENWQIKYIGEKNSIEQKLITAINVDFYPILSGKLRRYFSWQNFIDPFKIIWGILEAHFLCRKLKPKIIFSKGGFVAFPVVVAAWLNRIPIISHESDLSPGLANKLSFPFVNKICLTFPDSTNYFSEKDQKKLIVTGTPIRQELFHGNPDLGRSICGFDKSKKIIFVFGGSLGAEPINKIIRELILNRGGDLLKQFQIAHVCGPNKIDPNINYPGYKQFEYLHEDFAHVIAAADLVISRAGANTIYELIALRKPHILIPLGTKGSRGDQIENAKHFAAKNLSTIIFAEELTATTLKEKINWVIEHKDEIIAKLNNFKIPDSVNEIYQLILNVSNN